MEYVYHIEYDQFTGWDLSARGQIGVFSNRHNAFKIFREVLFNKLEVERKKNIGIILNLQLHKGKDRVYIDINVDEGWEESWRLRLVRYKLNEVLNNV
jgi:hypothetical protein